MTLFGDECKNKTNASRVKQWYNYAVFTIFDTKNMKMDYIRYPNNFFLLWTSRADIDELTKLDKAQTPTFSVKLALYGPIHEQRWPYWHLISGDIFVFCAIADRF